MRYLFIAVLAFVLSLPVAAQDYEKAINAARSGDYATALYEWRIGAERGQARAFHNLAFAYSNGRGVSQDFGEAATLYRKAAQQGLHRSQANLGGLYARGLGVPQNFTLAYKWMSLAAGAGLSWNWTQQDRDLATRERQDIIRRMTSEQIAQAQRLVSGWRPVQHQATAVQDSVRGFHGSGENLADCDRSHLSVASVSLEHAD